MAENDKEKVVKLTLIDTISNILIGELKSIVYNHQGAAYSKFLNIAISIEYLGACLDHHPFDKPKESENRFNEALETLEVFQARHNLVPTQPS
jgi:hypothetical protein